MRKNNGQKRYLPGLLVFMVIWCTQLPAGQWRIVPQKTFPATDLEVRKIHRGIAIDLDVVGNVYIIDSQRNQLLKFSPDGEFIKQIGGFGNTAEEFDDPRDVTARNSLDIFVADFNNNRVVRFDKDLNYLNELLSQWPEPYYFEQVISLAISPQYDLFVLENSQKRIIKFSRFSEPTASFGGIHETFGQLLDPYQLCLDGSRRLFVSDPGQEAVIAYDYLGNYVAELKHDRLTRPAGIYVADNGSLYVLNAGTPEIHVFDRALHHDGIIMLSPHLKSAKDISIRSTKSVSSFTLYVLEESLCWIFKLERVK